MTPGCVPVHAPWCLSKLGLPFSKTCGKRPYLVHVPKIFSIRRRTFRDASRHALRVEDDPGGLENEALMVCRLDDGPNDLAGCRTLLGEAHAGDDGGTRREPPVAPVAAVRDRGSDLGGGGTTEGLVRSIRWRGALTPRAVLPPSPVTGITRKPKAPPAFDATSMYWRLSLALPGVLEPLLSPA